MGKRKKGDRIIQIILLILLAGGISASLYLQMSSASGGSGGASFGPPGSWGGGRPGGEANGEADPAVAVEAQTIESGDISQSIKVNGDVSVETAVALYPDTGGRLVRLPVSLGDRVSKGQVIAAVDPSVPGQVYSVSPVHSTIDGTVIDLPYRIGDTVGTQSALATVGDLNDLVIMTYIPERFISGLKTGLKADIYLDAYPEELFQAVLYEINPVMDAGSRTLSVKLRLPGSDSRIRPGMFATVKLIIRESRGALAVPHQALFDYYGDEALYVINGEGRAERRLVKTGLTSDRAVEITEGLEEGDRVIVQGLNKITDGSAVRAVGENAAEARP